VNNTGHKLTGAYLTVQIKGPDLERFLNTCTREGILLWDTYRYPSLLIVHMHPRDFFKLKQITYRTGWQIKIIERKGVWFVLSRLTKRKALAMGGLVALLAWYFLSSFIWFVTITGVDRVEKNDILAIAAQFGLAPGRLKAEVDKEEVKRNLLINLDDLIWAGVEIKGTHAVISVAERSTPQVEASKPGHIIAGRDGVIESIMVIEGTGMVKENDTVKKGQILISGLLEPGSLEFIEKIQQGDLPYIRAQGKITATVWYETTVDVKKTGLSDDQAKDLAKEAAWLQMEAILKDKLNNVNGQPLIEWVHIPEEGIWRARVLIQTIEPIGVFFPVGP
jgi:similar to stage IV sporulation protein